MNMISNEQKVKLKNAIMQVWSEVKQEAQPKNLKDILQDNREKERQKNLRIGNRPNDDEQEKTEEEQIEVDSKTSYFTQEQYYVLDKRIKEANYRLKEQQNIVEKLDKHTGELIQKVKDRRLKKGISLEL